MVSIQVAAGVLVAILLEIALFGCKGIIPIIKDFRERKKKEVLKD